MNRRFLIGAIAFGALCAAAPAAAARPNIVLILADDLGWSDLGCYGADLHETPQLDRFARTGIRFTDAYAMSVCSPTRAALLTGKHAARLQITIWAEGSLKGPANRRLLQAASRHDLPHTTAIITRKRTASTSTLAARTGARRTPISGHTAVPAGSRSFVMCPISNSATQANTSLTG